MDDGIVIRPSGIGLTTFSTVKIVVATPNVLEATV